MHKRWIMVRICVFTGTFTPLVKNTRRDTSHITLSIAWCTEVFIPFETQMPSFEGYINKTKDSYLNLSVKIFVSFRCLTNHEPSYRFENKNMYKIYVILHQKNMRRMENTQSPPLSGATNLYLFRFVEKFSYHPSMYKSFSRDSSPGKLTKIEYLCLCAPLNVIYTGNVEQIGSIYSLLFSQTPVPFEFCTQGTRVYH